MKPPFRAVPGGVDFVADQPNTQTGGAQQHGKDKLLPIPARFAIVGFVVFLQSN
jgi:hypothetical protein